MRCRLEPMVWALSEPNVKPILICTPTIYIGLVLEPGSENVQRQNGADWRRKRMEVGVKRRRLKLVYALQVQLMT